MIIMKMVYGYSKQYGPADLCSLCSSSWQSLQVSVSHVSQKSLRASCLCTGQKTGLWPDVPTDSTKQNHQSQFHILSFISSLSLWLPYVPICPLPNSIKKRETKWVSSNENSTGQASHSLKTLLVAIATVLSLLNVQNRCSTPLVRHPNYNKTTRPKHLQQSYRNCLANLSNCKWKWISLHHIPGDTSSFLRILWSLVNLTRWCASMQVLQSHSPHSTQNPMALALSSQLVQTYRENRGWRLLK